MPSAENAAGFAGYAPVLEAVANVLAGATNISTLQNVPDNLQNRVLQELTQRILEREAEKLRRGSGSDVRPSRRVTWFALVNAVIAFDTDISPNLLPFNPVRYRLSCGQGCSGHP
jgi:hypothetical protein